MIATVHGLVLAGGRSSRMQRDKAALSYHGRTQLQWGVDLLAAHLPRVFVSVRSDQLADPVRARFECITDTLAGAGPIAGIAAAQSRHPEAAWLVLACDLPFLDAATVGFLLEHRDPQRQATAFRSSHDGLPEPLCAIYEPASAPAITDWIAGGQVCPRKFLRGADVLLLDEPNPRALDNVNTPDEYGAAVSALAGMP
ncbi:MAG TPA: NTP transferase domain-containing protein [Steroidobacteraceae bacterium]|nr:NTP transferase domain-containing protein [Steroidobacteraceae bacterium]